MIHQVVPDSDNDTTNAPIATPMKQVEGIEEQDIPVVLQNEARLNLKLKFL
jgi:hypothetical protein